MDDVESSEDEEEEDEKVCVSQVFLSLSYSGSSAPPPPMLSLHGNILSTRLTLFSDTLYSAYFYRVVCL